MRILKNNVTLIMPAKDLALLILLFFTNAALCEHKILFSKTYYIEIIIIKEIVYPKINSVVMFPYDFLQWNANRVKC